MKSEDQLYKPLRAAEKKMTTKVTIKNHGPDTVRVETVNPDSGALNESLILQPGQESIADLYVYDNQIVRVIEEPNASK